MSLINSDATEVPPSGQPIPDGKYLAEIVESENPNKNQVDFREQLCNEGRSGPITKVSLPEVMITSIRGIMLDFDPSRFKPEWRSGELGNPISFFEELIGPMLARHPVLAKAEVRFSGQGLHVIIHFSDPIEFKTEADRQLWKAIVKVIQRLLPTDPDCPGITAMTRPIGSVNSKNGAIVTQLHKGEPVKGEEVLGLFNLAHTSPFRTVARLLFGSERIQPCPICNGPESQLNAMDREGNCYGRCGKVRFYQLFDVFFAPRPVSNLHPNKDNQEGVSVAKS